MTPGPPTPLSKAGISEDPNGSSFIPSSTRADGSVRKEIRVRPGYKPPEDVEVYKNRTAESWKSRGKGGIPGAEFVEASKPKKSSKKSAKKEKTLEAAKEGTVKDGPGEENAKQEEATPIDPEAEKQKEARKLSKKLRQARDLQKKKEGGDALLPEQFEKVIKINELIRQLDKLGFDQEGQKKPEG